MPCFRQVVNDVCHMLHRHIPQLLIIQPATSRPQQQRPVPCLQLTVPSLYNSIAIAIITTCRGLQPCFVPCIVSHCPLKGLVIITVKPHCDCIPVLVKQPYLRNTSLYSPQHCSRLLVRDPNSPSNSCVCAHSNQLIQVTIRTLNHRADQVESQLQVLLGLPRPLYPISFMHLRLHTLMASWALR